MTYRRQQAKTALTCAFFIFAMSGAGFAQTAAAPAQREKGQVKVERLSLADAIEDLSRSDPSVLSDFYRSAGEAYLRQNKTDKAISLLEGYRKGGGSDPMILSRLAELYTQREAYPEAIEITEKLVKDRPQETSHQARLTMLYRQKGDLAKAAEFLEKRTSSDPKSAEDWAQLAEIYREKGDSAKAEKALQKAAETDPRAMYFNRLARLRLRTGGLEPAVAVIKDGLKKAPQDEVELSMTLVDLYAESGQKEKAVETLTSLLAKTNDPVRKQELQRRLDYMKQAAPPADQIKIKPLPVGASQQVTVPLPVEKAPVPAEPAATAAVGAGK